MGNPNPSPATRFVKGKSGNPSGRSAAELKIDREAAAMAAKLRHAALSCLTGKIQGDEISDETLAMLVNPATLKLFKDSEDRAYGTPTQAVDHKSSDGSMTPEQSKIDPALVSALVKKLTNG